MWFFSHGAVSVTLLTVPLSARCTWSCICSFLDRQSDNQRAPSTWGKTRREEVFFLFSLNNPGNHLLLLAWVWQDAAGKRWNNCRYMWIFHNHTSFRNTSEAASSAAMHVLELVQTEISDRIRTTIKWISMKCVSGWTDTPPLLLSSSDPVV